MSPTRKETKLNLRRVLISPNQRNISVSKVHVYGPFTLCELNVSSLCTAVASCSLEQLLIEDFPHHYLPEEWHVTLKNKERLFCNIKNLLYIQTLNMQHWTSAQLKKKLTCLKVRDLPLAIQSAYLQANTPQSLPFFCWGISCFEYLNLLI